MNVEASPVWQNETSVWFQAFSEVGPNAFRLEREYVVDPGGSHFGRERVSTPVIPDPRKASLVWATRTGDDSTVDIYELSKDKQLSSLLLADVRAQSDYTGSFIELANLLANTHRGIGPDPRRPYHLSRLAGFLSGSLHASPEANVLRKLSDAHKQCLLGWVSEFDEVNRGVLTHGNVTLNSIFLDDDGLELPIGPEVCTTYPEFDVGWLLGELTELEYSFSARGLDSTRFASYGNALVKAYETAIGNPLDVIRMAKVVALRICLHYFDFSKSMPTMPIGIADMTFLDWLIDRARAMERSN